MTTTPVGSAPLRERVAEELRALLARRQVTATALGRKLGRSQTWVWRRLQGEVAFDLNDLEAIAGVLEVAVADLFPPDIVQTQITSRYKVQPTERPKDGRPPARPNSRVDRSVLTSPSSRRPRRIGVLNADPLAQAAA